MKLANDVLVEIIDIVRTGIAEGVDISDLLRQLEVEEKSGELVLTKDYLAAKGRIV